MCGTSLLEGVVSITDHSSDLPCGVIVLPDMHEFRIPSAEWIQLAKGHCHSELFFEHCDPVNIAVCSAEMAGINAKSERCHPFLSRSSIKIECILKCRSLQTSRPLTEGMQLTCDSGLE